MLVVTSRDVIVGVASLVSATGKDVQIDGLPWQNVIGSSIEKMGVDACPNTEITPTASLRFRWR